MREQLKADALAKLKASCPTLFSMGWFKENLPAVTEEETAAVEEAGSGDKQGGGEAAEDVTNTDIIKVDDEDEEGVTDDIVSEIEAEEESGSE